MSYKVKKILVSMLMLGLMLILVVSSLIMFPSGSTHAHGPEPQLARDAALLNPVACFNASPMSGNRPLHVNVDASCSSGAMFYEWDFGNGDSDSGLTASTTYMNAGTYTIWLGIAPGVSTTRTITVNDTPPPNIQITGPSSAEVGQYVQFGYTNSGGNIVSWNWTFGPGASPSSHNGENPPPVVYNSSGSKTVSLTVLGEYGSDADTHTISISPAPTVPPNMNACFSYSPHSGPSPLQVNADASCSSGAQFYEWDFGNGQSASGLTANTTYNTGGTYVITLTIAPGISVSHTVTVTDTPPPSIYLQASPVSGQAPLLITVEGIVNPGSGPIDSWQWALPVFPYSASGQGPYSTTLQQAGAYTFSLTAIGDGGTDTDTFTVIVTAPPTSTPAPQLDVTITGPSSAQVGEAVQISYTAENGPVTQWSWDFGPGASPSGSTTAGPHTVTYSTIGQKPIELIASGPHGTDIATHMINITAPPPVADFSFPPNMTTHVPVHFTDTSTPPQFVNSWTWDFGDGGSSTVRNPNHTYLVAGSYNVTLTVLGPGGSDSITKTITVDPVPPPTACALVWPQNGQWPEDSRVSFNATECSEGVITNYAWDFGDGTISIAPNTHHTYASGGVYVTSLMVTGPGGSDTASVVINLQHPPQPNVNIEDIQYDGNFPYARVDITFIGEIQGYYETWEWDFGDGNSQTGTSKEDDPPQVTHQYEQSGTYRVTLTASHYHASTSISTDVVVEVLPPPQPVIVVNFIGTASEDGYTFEFNDTSQSDLVVAWLWEFGDGAVSYERSPTHTYVDPLPPEGYTVTLTTTNIVRAQGQDTERLDFTSGQYRAYQCTESLVFTINVGGKIIEVDLDALHEAMIKVNLPPLVPIPHHEIRAVLFVNDVYGFPASEVVDPSTWTNGLSGWSIFFEPGNQTPIEGQYTRISTTEFEAGAQLEWVATLRLSAEVTAKLDPEGATIKIGEISITGGVELEIAFYGQSTCYGHFPGKWVELPLDTLSEAEISQLTANLSPEEQEAFQRQLDQ